VLIPDINILIYAYDSTSPRHAEARRWWETTLAGERPVGLAWATMLGFIRIMTHPRIQARPMRVTDCVRRVRSWIEHPRTEILTPGEQHADILFRFLTQLGSAGNLTSDAYLAALAVEYQAELVSTDADFARFQGLRWFNPLPR
jgi:hypothetical protein